MGLVPYGGPLKPVVGTFRWRPEETVLLCTDGLTDLVEDEKILAYLAIGSSPRVATAALIDLALNAGGKDNVRFYTVCRSEKCKIGLLGFDVCFQGAKRKSFGVPPVESLQKASDSSWRMPLRLSKDMAQLLLDAIKKSCSLLGDPRVSPRLGSIRERTSFIVVVFAEPCSP